MPLQQAKPLAMSLGGTGPKHSNATSTKWLSNLLGALPLARGVGGYNVQSFPEQRVLQESRWINNFSSIAHWDECLLQKPRLAGFSSSPPKLFSKDHSCLDDLGVSMVDEITSVLFSCLGSELRLRSRLAWSARINFPRCALTCEHAWIRNASIFDMLWHNMCFTMSSNCIYTVHLSQPALLLALASFGALYRQREV